MTTQSTMAWYIIFCAVMLLCLAANFKVIHILFVLLPERGKRLVFINKLIFQLSLISIGNLAVLIISVGDRVGLVDQKGYTVRLLMEFLKTTLPCAFCTTMAAIIYERVSRFGEYDVQILKSRLVALSWILPIIYGIPNSLISTNSERNDLKIDNSTELGNYSLPVPRSESNYMTLITDGTRILIFHAGVSGYMAYAIFQIRSKIHYLIRFMRDSTGLYEGKLRNIRFMYSHFIGFVLFSIMIAILYITRLVKHVTRAVENEDEESPDSLLNEWGDLILMIYYAINCLVNFYFLDTDLHLLPEWCPFFNKYENCATEDEEVEMSELHEGATETEEPRHSFIHIEVMQLCSFTSSTPRSFESRKQDERGEEKVVERNDDVLYEENEEEQNKEEAEMNEESEVKVEVFERVVRETMV